MKIFNTLLLLTFLVSCSPGETSLVKNQDEVVKAAVPILPSSTLTIQSTETRFSTITPLPTDTLIPPSLTPTPMPTVTPTLTPTASMTPTATQVTVLACVQRFFSINIRKEPSISSLRVGNLNLGECTTIIARTRDGLWGKDVDGWMQVELLELSGDFYSLPIQLR